ncbi:berberine bridge enzyme-like Cyn d 4 [Panicum virgatum]|uniref:berberine bridge enzyme-like Cyn d 4 n=1 Tax=Panicum virgatum TaxID=38727 RepID=UPI0019D5286E|nr:berberine bridge enzyme-like Cyn d 4 [Panicum virgatum]
MEIQSYSGGCFPEVGMNSSHCREMSWIESVLYVYMGSGQPIPVTDLRNRTTSMDTSNKVTSDYVRRAIPRDVWAEIFGWLSKPDPGIMILDPYGGAIYAVPEAATLFPHRGGMLYNIYYMNYWAVSSDGEPNVRWIRDLYAFMAPYVSKNPREAYFNYRDLDLGRNVVVGNVSSYEAGKVWGEKYFKGNYERLALAKGKIDPDNYFWNEQSIPPLVHESNFPY